MPVLTRVCFLLVGAATVARPSSTQAFQGVVTLRTIRAHAADLAEDEQANADKILAIPVEQILAKVRSGELTARTDTLVFELKGSKARSGTTARAGSHEMYSVGDFQTGVFRVVVPEQRAYSEFTREDLKKMMEGLKKAANEVGAADPTAASAIKVEPLGATKTIAGFRCTSYRWTSGGTVGIAWLTKDLMDAASAFVRMGELTPGGEAKGGANPWAPFAKFGFPCLTQQLETEEGGTPSGYEISELVSVDRRAPADDRFVVPAGFRKMTVPQ